MKHYLLTSINMHLYTPKEKEAVFYVKDIDLWFKKRLRLLERICIPSVKGQTNKNFVWLWRVDPNTPKDHLEKLKELAQEIPDIVFTSNFLKNIGSPAQSTITTRMDSDDALAPTFIDTIQKAAQHLKPPTVINLPYGINYDIVTKMGRIFHKPFVNQFASLLEASEEVRGVLCEQHANLFKAFPVSYVKTDTPMWIWFLHEYQATKIHRDAGFIPMDLSKLKPHFNIKKF